MVPIENYEVGNGDIVLDLEKAACAGTKMRLGDYIPIYVPAVDRRLMNSQSSHDKRFLDFLRARPAKDWFFRFGFVGRTSPLSFLRRRSASPAADDPTLTALTSGAGRRRFRVPFVRRINWRALGGYFKDWIKNPANIAFFIWLVFVAAGLLLLLLVMTGILNGAIPSSSRRKDWNEVINQILNALFTVMCIYQHPTLFHHLVLLLRWGAKDRVQLRQAYCKDGAVRDHERAHMAFVLLLFHLTCFAQYTLIGLYWAYNRHTRPDWAETLCIVIGVAAPIVAGVHLVFGPLGRKHDDSEVDEDVRRQAAAGPEQDRAELRPGERRVVETNPEWIGGLFDCWDDLTVFYLSFFCTFCVFGWNMERLGFGNMYVHIATFMLLCIAPFWIFNISALNIDDDTIRYVVGIAGIVVAVFGLLYGGFWRIQMRKRFKLPPNPFCLDCPSVSDCAQWLFCWSCSLAQEVRTGNFYDVEDDSFHRQVPDQDGQPVLLPLPREGGNGTVVGSVLEYQIRSASCPPRIFNADTMDCADHEDKRNGAGPHEFSLALDRSNTYSGAHDEMRAPTPMLI